MPDLWDMTIYRVVHHEWRSVRYIASWGPVMLHWLANGEFRGMEDEDPDEPWAESTYEKIYP